MCAGNRIRYAAAYQKKENSVILEFPEQPDGKAEQEFRGRLKELLLQKLEEGLAGSMESAMPYSDGREGEGNGDE